MCCFLYLFARGSRIFFKYPCLEFMKVSIGWILTYSSEKNGLYLHPQSEHGIIMNEWTILYSGSMVLGSQR